MADETHVDKLKQGVEAWNAWRRDDPDVVPDLCGFDFGTMDVSGADFRKADMRGARLSNVDGLLPATLACADLTNAELPAELSDFPALAHVAEVSRHARVNFLAVVASCVFCWLTIAQTSDAPLLANRGEMPLPVINTRVPVTGFFLFAPAILLALYVYLQLYLQRMWDGLSRLPAIFPDGARLDQKAFPWLLSGLISLYVPRLRDGAPPFAWLQWLLSIVAAWLLVPATIAWFWLRYLLVTNEVGIAPHVFLLALAMTFGVLFYRRAHDTLLGRQSPPRHAPFPGRLLGSTVARSLMVFVACLGASVAATYGVRFGSAHWHLEFRGEEVVGTAKIAEEADKNAGIIARLKRLDLTRVHFRHAEGRGAILFRVDLREVDLSFAQFHDADLRGADLQGANLTGARLVGAKLQGALLANTRLDYADLTRADALTQQMLAGACGEGAVLPSDLSVMPCEASKVQVAAVGEEPGPDRPGTETETQVAVGAYVREPGAVFRDCKEVCPEMVVVPAGAFVMGSSEDEKDRFAIEGPQHGVTIAAPFAVGKFEVTFAEWDACVDAGGCDGYRPGDREWGRDKRPVINVSWQHARSYVKWLSGKTGKDYRLLTEAEWEYAARAGTTTRYWWGQDIGRNNANCIGCGSEWDGKRTAPVGSFPANAFGLHDVHGNVWEWVEDVWHEDYTGAPVDGSAWTEGGDQGRRVLRGGSWSNGSRNLRSALRVRNRPGNRGILSGFRVARTF